MFLPKTYFPDHADNRMENEGDVESSRENFLKYRPRNLEFLLRKRYTWMNDFIKPEDKIVEFGSGSGFGKLFIPHKNYLLTDTIKRPWIDQEADAMDPPFEDGSLDVVICSHVIHHLSNPMRFFRVMCQKLRPGGKVLIQELNTCFLLRVLLRIMRHEGWSYEVDVFDETAVANDPRDPWSANCAIPELLFQDEKAFSAHVSGLSLEKNHLNECFIFPLSGGVIAKRNTIQLPNSLLNLIDLLDRLLIRLIPSVFAMGRSVVLVKK